jgi:hypothetical protein
MQRFLFPLVAAASIAAGAGCRQQDLRTHTILLSGISGEADVQSVSNTLAQLDGVFDNSIAFQGLSVSVRYDSMKLARKNLEYAIAGAGFGANDIPPKRAAPDGPRAVSP